MTAWRSASANNPANLEVYRGVIDTLMAQPRIPREYLGLGYYASQQLLKRTGTNLANVTLVAGFNSRAQLHESNVGLLRPLGTNHTPQTARLLAGALFQTGAMDEFGKFLSEHEADLEAAPELALTITAWKAGWGPAAGMQAARDRLAAARRVLATGTEASRLQLKVAFRRTDLDGHRDALNQLMERHEDAVGDHVSHWNLLVQAGRRAEAAELARNFATAPDSATEAVGLAVVFDALGMTRYAAEFCEKQLSDFAFSSGLWVVAGDLWSQLGEWNRVRALAIRMRSEPALAGTMTAYSWFLEGLVEVRLNRAGTADENFSHIAESGFPDPGLAAKTAASLRKLDRPNIALGILRQIEKDYGDSATFWADLGAAAYEARDMDTTALAIGKAYAIDPSSDQIANNQAAVLIATETRPEEALKLTMRLLAKHPGSVDLNINHSLALINIGRTGDAESIVRGISPVGLTPEEKSVLNFAWFRIHESRTNGPLALRAAAEIDRSHLMPPQVDRLDLGLKRLAP